MVLEQVLLDKGHVARRFGQVRDTVLLDILFDLLFAALRVPEELILVERLQTEVVFIHIGAPALPGRQVPR